MKKSHLRLIITFALSIIFVFLTLGFYQTSLSENPKDKEITLVLAGKYKIKPEKRERFLELAKPGFEKTRQEPGNVSYNLYEKFGNPNTFLYFEEWVDREALNSHLKQPYIT
ncbi:MAG: antibiotic biosynthesis monooxygenase, partial [Okeania sp. SIO2D1]|nr:antibiotic biosynthesis monooxygenase [Okeania sp. SIO2D1]